MPIYQNKRLKTPTRISLCAWLNVYDIFNYLLTKVLNKEGKLL